MAKSDTIFNSFNAEYYTDSPASAEKIHEQSFLNNSSFSQMTCDLQYNCTSGSVIITTEILDTAGVVVLTNTNTLAEKLAYGWAVQKVIDITALSTEIYRLRVSVQGNGVNIQYLNYQSS